MLGGNPNFNLGLGDLGVAAKRCATSDDVSEDDMKRCHSLRCTRRCAVRIAVVEVST